MRTPAAAALLSVLLSIAALVTLFIFADAKQADQNTLLFWMSVCVCGLVGYLVYHHKGAARARARLADELAMEMLRSSKELFAEVYHNSPVPYLLLSAEGTVLSVNTAAIRLFKLQKDTLHGENIFSYFTHTHQDHLTLMQHKYARGVSITSEEVQVLQKDGGTAWAQLSLFRFADEKNQHLGLLTLVDITKQKEIDTAKSEFVSLASHQLRTPIAGMRWSGELLLLDERAPLSELHRKYAQRLLASIKRMSLLVDDFLSVSRFELGALHAEEQTVALVPLLEEIMSEHAATVAEKRISVTRHFDPSLSEVMSDPKLLTMIFGNLYANAVKYTRADGQITVGYGRANGMLTITVADNGIGIPVAEHSRIFSKIFRASNALREVPDGTGLGLYIARQAATVLKGNISFVSAEHVGTTFTVTLPLN